MAADGTGLASSGESGTGEGFHVSLDVFSGPFDLLLSLISRHRLDITEVSLARVTDEFIAYISADWDLGQASEFLVVAATLLDLKAARLLPRGDVDSEEDLELLEARDLLFARLLAYKAFKEVAGEIEARLQVESRRRPRAVPLEPHFAALLPELVFSVGPEGLAALAARALAPKPGPPQVALDHLHAPEVSVREEGAHVMARLRRAGTMTFRSLVADASGLNVVVARFLALLELFRSGAVAFEQAEALGELSVRWSGGDREFEIGQEFDEDGAGPAGDAGSGESVGPAGDAGSGESVGPAGDAGPAVSTVPTGAGEEEE
ncbi:MAG TPA: segregation/condensation protein A [Actinomycetales bacterium]|nr:segregation/condensation protein A [Actinomycetales bacterium]